MTREKHAATDRNGYRRILFFFYYEYSSIMSLPPGGSLARMDNEPVCPGPRRNKHPLLVI